MKIIWISKIHRKFNDLHEIRFFVWRKNNFFFCYSNEFSYEISTLDIFSLNSTTWLIVFFYLLFVMMCASWLNAFVRCSWCCASDFSHRIFTGERNECCCESQTSCVRWENVANIQLKLMQHFVFDVTWHATASDRNEGEMDLSEQHIEYEH